MHRSHSSRRSSYGTLNVNSLVESIVHWISFALRKGQRRPRNDPDGPDMDHPRRSSPAHIPWGPYGQREWVVVTCACDPLPSRRPRTLKRARTGGSGRRLSGSLAGDSGDHHQYQRRGIVSCDVYEDSQALRCGVQGVQREKVGKNQKSSASNMHPVLN